MPHPVFSTESRHWCNWSSPARGPLLPEGEIVDWPDLQLRLIYWDDAHHLERKEAFRKAIQQAAFFKINAIAIKLEGHFVYKRDTSYTRGRRPSWSLMPYRRRTCRN